jgi:fatty-acyl-CoA synthase
MLHALPLYHCAQLDVFLGPASTWAPPASSPPSPRPTTCCRCWRHRITSFFAPPTVWIALLRSPLFDTARPGQPAQGLLRRVSIMPVAVMRELIERCPDAAVELLRPDRDRAAGHGAGPEDQLRKPGSAGRAALNVETRVVDDDMNDVASPARWARSCTAART